MKGGLFEEDTFELKDEKVQEARTLVLLKYCTENKWVEIEQSEQWENDMLENEGGKDCDMEFGFFTQFNFIFRKAKNWTL